MITLCREALQPLLMRDFAALGGRQPHSGLLLARGLRELPTTDTSEAGNGDTGDTGGNSQATAGQCKATHIAAVVAAVQAARGGALYAAAYARWCRLTDDVKRFAVLDAPLAGRLYVGVARDNALETGVSLAHTYGMPFIPGSAVKGLCRAAAGEWLAQREARRYLFGDDRRPRAAKDASDADADAGIDSEIGGVVFHDAWWNPAGDAPPLVAEVVTGHHAGYYGSEGRQDATDFDAPIPAPQIAVSGRFRFVIEGDPAWTRLARRLLAGGLQQRGIGGKRSSGYGHFVRTPSADRA